MANYGHISDYLEKYACLTPDKLALITDDRSLSWAQLECEVRAGAAYLSRQLPEGSQQTIALLMPNTWQCVVAYLSVVHAGHMALPIDVIFKPMEIEAVLKQVPAALLITDRAGAARVKNDLIKIVNIDDFPADPPASEPPYHRLPADKQVASLLFTSGTTGRPKVVPYTHANHLWNIDVCSRAWEWTTDDVQLVSARLSHMLGIVMGVSGTLYHGNTMYLQDRFDAKKTLELLAGGKITMFSHGPLVFSRLLQVEDRDQYDISKVRLFICGSGPLPPALWRQFKDEFGAEILEVYGTTETGRIASNLLNERIPGSPGRPLPGVKVEFDGHGQVMVKSGGVFSGYLNNKEATKKHLAPGGFWKTGDIGELKNGRLVLKGRLQERIRKQGYSVSPRDVEWALHSDKRIKEALVMGVSSGADDNKIVYFLSGDINEDEVRKFCAANLPSVWRPDQVFLLDSLPRTRVGKPELAKLRAMLN